jgi:hypothetical protein
MSINVVRFVLKHHPDLTSSDISQYSPFPASVFSYIFVFAKIFATFRKLFSRSAKINFRENTKTKFRFNPSQEQGPELSSGGAKSGQPRGQARHGSHVQAEQEKREASR